MICINGAAAHRFTPGDIVIIATSAVVEEAEAQAWTPTVVLVDEHNRIKDPNLVEIAGPKRRTA